MKKPILRKGLGLAAIILIGMNQAIAAIDFSGEERNQLIGVRLTEATKEISALKPLKELSQTVQSDWDKLVTAPFQLDEILNIFLTQIPSETAGIYKVSVAAFGPLASNKQLAFIMADIYFDKAIEVKVSQILPLAKTQFEINASLSDRKLILSDTLSDLKMVFPIGVGSFDEGVLNEETSILTPRFENSYLDQYAAISKRDKPRYFAGKPFLRITTAKNPADGHTPIGFHAQPNLDPFVRAFDSHGCMRMQTDDLQMLHDLLKGGPHRRLSVNVKFKIDDPSEHPEPKINRPYKRVLNVGSTQNPNYTIDRDGLVQTTKDWENYAPVEQLQDVAGDSYHALFNYDMAWREKERMKAHRAGCYQEFPYDQESGFFKEKKMKIKYNKCVKEGERNNSLSDHFYQMWVH